MKVNIWPSHKADRLHYLNTLILKGKHSNKSKVKSNNKFLLVQWILKSNKQDYNKSNTYNTIQHIHYNHIEN